ncbi:MAG: glutamine--fructose-6-phosphate aminotransferase, partial [Bacteroidota bacterium]
MCGIVAYMGDRQAAPLLIKGLKRLEYRGYDSAGIAIMNDGQDITAYKKAGKVADLENTIGEGDTQG